MKKFRINIDGRELLALPGQTILEVARENDIFIPTLCFDERTEIYGSCGICMVEAEGNPKLLKACATEIAPNMVITTDSERVIESRKTNLELLLSNHPGDCRPPCVLNCPAHTDCQGYVGLLANGRPEEAHELVKNNIPLPASIGRVCPHPCEDSCRRKYVDEPISIANIKRFLADNDLMSGVSYVPDIEAPTGKSVAVIGGGPFGLSLAYFLAQKGHAITIFEAMPKAGGMLRYGIPEYRLPNEIIDSEIALIEAMGVEILTNTKIGRDVDFGYIRDTFDAVSIGIGAWVSTGTGAKGEDAEGVIGGIDMLRHVVRNEELALGDNVAIVGGGNTAMDACRTAVRLGAKKVYNVYRRTVDEMPADQIEIDEALEEGVIFKNLRNPLEIVKDKNGHVSKIKLQVMELGEPDASGRRAPVAVKGKTETIAVDSVILAIGQAVDPLGFDEVDLTKKNGIVYDPETFMTSIPGVFAGGDCGNDKISIAVEAIADAKKSAVVIDSYLFGEDVSYEPEFVAIRDDISEKTFEDRERQCRPVMEGLTPEERKTNFTEVVFGYDEERATQDADRCLECGCGDYFECKLVDFANQYDVKPDRFKGDVSVSDEEGKALAPDATDDGHPFIIRESGKCILCGLCVRACDQVMGIGAIDLVDRGFDTIVQPTLLLPLEESGCVSCGQCVSVCPTGALRERLSIPKSVPLETDVVQTTCSHCSIGCTLDLETYGDLLYKVNPTATGVVNAGVTCGRGKFGFDCAELEGRLTEPLLAIEGAERLVESDYYDAFVMTAKKAQSITARYGEGAVAIAVSDRYTNEEIYAISRLADEIGADIFSFNNRASATSTVLGVHTSPNSIDELLGTNYILGVGFDPHHNPVARLKIDTAKKNGAKVVFIDPSAKKDGLNKFGYDSFAAANNVKLLREIAAAVVSEKKDSDKARLLKLNGYKEFAASLADVKVSAKAAQIAADYLAAKKAIIIYQQNILSFEAAELVCAIAAISGHIGTPRDGIVRVASKNNSQGLYDLGITSDATDVEGAKAVLIFGEDPLGQIAAISGTLPPEAKAAKALLKNAEFVMVCDTHNTATALEADVVIPGSGWTETDGTYTNTEGRLGEVVKVSETSDFTNWQVAKEIANIYEAGILWENEDDIADELADEYPAYRYAVIGEILPADVEADDIWLAAPEAGKLVDPLPVSDNLTNMIDERLPKPTPMPHMG
ncbi:MAG: FAD-dependent oxidoreductase [Clostridiales Family XIII bacterium]|jgi:formate dehydrogenase major subunit|nr:FAD-dependent oxidoreductase [Clostridiales Family XIII bacterium]